MQDKTIAKEIPSRMLRAVLEDKKVKKIIKSAGVVLIGNTGASILNFISFTIVVNNLGARLLALLVLTQTYTVIVNSIFNIPTWESVVKFGHSESSGGIFSNVVKVNFLIDLISALIAFLAAIALINPVIAIFKWDPEISWLILLYTLTIPFNLTTFKVGIPRFFDKFSSVAKVNVYMAALKIVLVLAVSRFDEKILPYAIVYIFVDVITSFILIVYSIRILNLQGHGGWLKKKMKIDFQHIKFVWWTNLRSIMRLPVQYCDMIIISMVMPLEAVGVYKVYKEIGGILGRIGDPINQTIYPEYARLIGNNDSKAATSLAKKTIFVLFAVSFAMTLIMILMSELLIGKFYGEDFLPSINALYMLIILFGVSLFTLPINSLFIAAGFAKFGFYIVVFTNILYILVAYIGGRLFGIYGVVAAYGIQMLFNVGLKIIFLKKYRMGWSDTIR